MSTNIVGTKALKLDAWMSAEDIVQFRKSDMVPENSFISKCMDPALALVAMGSPKAYVYFETFKWCGEGSGWSYKFLRDEVGQYIKGRVEVVFFWEGGNEPTGLVIQDGKVTECEAVMSLKPIEAE